MAAPSAAAAVPRLAATSIILSNNASGAVGFKVLMIKRHTKARFMANMYAFPGGCLEPEDQIITDKLLPTVPARTPNTVWSASTMNFRVGAIRETFEETKCTVKANGTVDGGSEPDYSSYGLLTPIAHWTTPKEEKYRYDTWFFGLPVEPDAPQKLKERLVRQESEIARIAWVDPKEALQQHENPKVSFNMAPPTYLMLDALSRFKTVEDVLAEWKRLGYTNGSPIQSTTADGKDSTNIPDICPTLTIRPDGFIETVRLPDTVSPYYGPGKYRYPNPSPEGDEMYTEFHIGDVDLNTHIVHLRH